MKRLFHCKLSLLLRLCLVLSLFAISALYSAAYNMRRTSNYDGLSNSAILSLCCDNDGFLWIGTCDGVNIADGTSVYPFKRIFPGEALSGNIIETILNGNDGNMWVLTNYGLDLVDTKARKVKTFHQFNGQERLCADPSGRIFIISEDSDLYTCNPSTDGDLIKLGHLGHTFTAIRTSLVRDGKLWVSVNDGVYIYDTAPLIASPKEKIAPAKILPSLTAQFAKAQRDNLLILSPRGTIFEVAPDGTPREIANISAEIARRGMISNIVRDNNGNIYVSFRTYGAIRISSDADPTPRIDDLGLSVGVFCLEQSPDQDIVWIGSDCQGVFTYWDDNCSVRSYDFNSFGHKISRPVRAVMIDDYKNLWIGTKGDGILRIADVNEFFPLRNLDKGELITSANSELHHNSVYAFARSSHPILWIGNEEGLNYYSYADNRVHSIRIPSPVHYIHGVHEASDSTLWLCTLGEGVARLTLRWNGNTPEVTDVKSYRTDNGKISSNQFFSMTETPDGTMLFCNRGLGMFTISDGRLTPLPMRNSYASNTVRDVFDAVKTDTTLWVGTGQGIIKSFPSGEEHIFGPQNGFNSNTVHKIISTNDGSIWVSTNNGIVRLNPDNGISRTFGEDYGLNVTEYSDGAGFYTGNTLIFGGINGLTFINRNEAFASQGVYSPSLSLLKLSISGQDVSIAEFLSSGKDRNRIILGPKQNNFSITLSAPDYINAHSYSYAYTLDGSRWIDTGPGTTISFNEMSHGTYHLKVKYINRSTGVESAPYALDIVVEAPWYLTWYAKLAYILLVLGAAGAGIFFYLQHQKQKQKEKLIRLEQTHREELYEEKLKFFTNITHEFCTPLTLIYGPCERIQDYPGSDDYIRRYVGLIRTNTERLNTLIQELIDFRRIETGNKILKPAMVEVSDLCNNICTSFSELAERNSINFINEVEPDINWPSDFSCVRKIVSNLISNAFKYTNTGGTIRVKASVEANRLRICVYNTGKGIREEDKAKIFNRYCILDNVEENAVKGLSSRNGLGMAIVHSMVDMLEGSVTIESTVGEFAEFIVDLPPLELPAVETPVATSPEQLRIQPVAAPDTPAADKPLPPQKPLSDDRILVVDDNKAILTLLLDSLSEFNVMGAESADKALEIIRSTPPDLIISDIMMPGTDGITFTQMIKGNKHTMHIPLILLSAKTSTEERINGIESGADAYITKPFSMTYLKAVAKRFLQSRSNLREYYNTAASAFEFNDGRLLHVDDKDFLEQIVRFIHQRIDDTELSPEHLADHMKISVRNLYRRFKELDQLSPNDFIKHQRITYAAKLLVTTSITVQEIIYRCGFTNRSHFYKEFDKRFGMTPKDYRTSNTTIDSSL